MKYLFKQFVIVISIITNNSFCNENSVTLLIPTCDSVSIFNTTPNTVDISSTLNNNENSVTLLIPMYDKISTFNTTQNIVNKYSTLNYFVNNNIDVMNNNTIHNFDYYQKMYNDLDNDIYQFRVDNKNNNCNINESNNIKNIFFSILHSIRNSLQKLVLSCNNINEQNKINTYININLAPKDIYLILS